MNKPYEFGNKVAIGVSGHGNFILGVKSFHGNPYDGHTLKQTVAQIEEITGQEPKKLFVDLGYRGANYEKKGKIYTPYTKKKWYSKGYVMDQLTFEKIPSDENYDDPQAIFIMSLGKFGPRTESMIDCL